MERLFPLDLHVINHCPNWGCGGNVYVYRQIYWRERERVEMQTMHPELKPELAIYLPGLAVSTPTTSG